MGHIEGMKLEFTLGVHVKEGRQDPLRRGRLDPLRKGNRGINPMEKRGATKPLPEGGIIPHTILIIHLGFI
jgi:hypothetical protein